MTLAAELRSLIADGESESLEFKKSTGEIKSGMQTLCAMLNHRGGRVLFGVERSGQVVGQNVSDGTLEGVTQEIKEIEPSVFPQVERIGVDGGREIVSVSVTTGQNRPLQLSKSGVQACRQYNAQAEPRRIQPDAYRAFPRRTPVGDGTG